MMLSIVYLVSGFAFGLVAAMMFAVVWRRIAARRNRQGFVFSDTAGSVLALYVFWSFVIYAADPPAVLIPIGYVIPTLLVVVEFVVNRRIAKAGT